MEDVLKQIPYYLRDGRDLAELLPRAKVSLIISSYVRHIWKTTGLKKQFASTQDILDEMRSIRCIEHNGRAKFITPFVGAQKDICKAFGFDIPEGCGTEYKSRKVSPKRRGRPAKAKTVKLDS